MSGGGESDRRSEREDLQDNSKTRLDVWYGDSGSNKKTGRRAGVGRVVESDQEEQD